MKLALEHGVPVVPVVALGGQETALFLGRGKRLAQALQLDRLARLKVLPVVLGPPFGLRKKLGRNPDIEDGYRLVTSRMQRTLTRLNNQRKIPVLG